MTLQQQAEENIKAVHQVAKENNINFCLTDGTLLGAYRDKDFCVNDWDDIDIAILDEEYDEAVKKLTKGLEELGFERYKDLEHKGMIEGFGIGRGGNHIDVIRVNKHPERDECFNLGRAKEDGHILAFVYPSHHFDKYEQIEFKGLIFNVPSDVEGFLTARYGNWKHKIDRPAFDWPTQSNTSCIRDDYDQI